MPAVFTVGATEATFVATINGSRQATQDDLPQLVLGTYFRDATEWDTLHSLVTTTYATQSPIGGDTVIIDVVRGAGQGTLLVDNLGSWYALLIDVQRTTYLPGDQSVGSATFVLTAPGP